MTEKYYFGHIKPWWTDEFKKLDYQRLEHRDLDMVDQWHKQGYGHMSLNGAFYGDASKMPEWTNPFYKLFDWTNTGLAIFRMDTVDILPVHRDHYNTYRRIYNITDPNKIWRCIVFLEDWKSGHYMEMNNQLVPQWRKGNYVVWNYDIPHMAANLGLEPRYTLQITGLN